MIIKYTCEPYLPVGQRRDQVLHMSIRTPLIWTTLTMTTNLAPGWRIDIILNLMMKSKQNYLVGLR